MAKRRRKVTLFDVINSGQPIGIQVRQRVPTYQPTPELPVKKKLAKWFGRKPKPDADRPLSAAEELEQLRRELGGSPTPAPVMREVEEAPEPVEPARAERSSRKEFDPTAGRDLAAERNHGYRRSADQETSPEPDPTAYIPDPLPPRRSAAEIAARLEAEEEVAPRTPREPRKPVGQIFSEQWSKVSPHLASLRVKTARLGTNAFQSTRTYVESFREFNTRHLMTGATVLGAIILLGGSFYLGKILLNRPAADPLLVDANGINTTPRPDVLDVNARANQPIANVIDAPNVALEKAAPPPPRTGVFSGRNLDQNYIIIQSYYTRAEADAAVDVLAKYGIRSNVELNLPNWSNGSRDLFSVVSADGFTRIKDNEVYQNFLAAVGNVSSRETGSTLPRRLDPRPYKYRAQE